MICIQSTFLRLFNILASIWSSSCSIETLFKRKNNAEESKPISLAKNATKFLLRSTWYRNTHKRHPSCKLHHSLFLKKISNNTNLLQCLNVANTKSFARWNTRFNTQPFPGCENHEFDSDIYWECCIRKYAGSLQHQVYWHNLHENFHIQQHAI